MWGPVERNLNGKKGKGEIPGSLAPNCVLGKKSNSRENEGPLPSAIFPSSIFNILNMKQGEELNWTLSFI